MSLRAVMACDLERRSSRVDILPGSPNQCHDSYQHQNTSEGHNAVSLPGCALARISNILICLVSAMCCDHVLLSCLTTYQLVAGVGMISASVQPTHQLAVQPTSVSDVSGLTTIVAHLHRNNDRITSANAAGHRTACVGMNSFTTSAAKC